MIDVSSIAWVILIIFSIVLVVRDMAHQKEMSNLSKAVWLILCLVGGIFTAFIYAVVVRLSVKSEGDRVSETRKHEPQTIVEQPTYHKVDVLPDIRKEEPTCTYYRESTFFSGDNYCKVVKSSVPLDRVKKYCLKSWDNCGYFKSAKCIITDDKDEVEAEVEIGKIRVKAKGKRNQ